MTNTPPPWTNPPPGYPMPGPAATGQNHTGLFGCLGIVIGILQILGGATHVANR